MSKTWGLMVWGSKSTEMGNEDIVLDATGRLSSKKRFPGFDTLNNNSKLSFGGGGPGGHPLGPI